MTTDNGVTTGYEAQLWQMADALRGSMDAAEYKHVVLGLIFLKYISDAFEEAYARLDAERDQGADPEDPDEYRAQSIFWVPSDARWTRLQSQAHQPTIGRAVDDGKGAIKVVMTGSASDPPGWQSHIRNKPRREALAQRFRDPADPLRVVLVRDMWLTGFDAPSLHTMYVDKPMRGHGLMQAIARVNRVFRDKPGGLVVDYLGLAHELKRSLATYTESGGAGRAALDQDDAVALMQEKYEVCRGLFHGFDWTMSAAGSPAERVALLSAALEHVLAQDDGKERCLTAVRELSQAFALAVPREEALRIRDDVGFFQDVRAALSKRAAGEARPEEDLDLAVRQIISRAVASEGVLDIFAAAGLDTPDISVLSDEFLAEVRGMPHRNLAVELLQKLLKGEIATRCGKTRQARSLLQPWEVEVAGEAPSGGRARTCPPRRHRHPPAGARAGGGVTRTADRPRQS